MKVHVYRLAQRDLFFGVLEEKLEIIFQFQKVCFHHECLKSEKQNVVAKLPGIIFFLIELACVSNTYTAFPGP